MTRLTRKLRRALVGTVAAGAMAVTTATPALARDRNNDGIDAGEVIAGALIIGGIAAVAAAASKKDRDRYGYGRDYRYKRAGYGNYYGGYGRHGSRGAVEACVRAAENNATRYVRGRADVTQVTRVQRKRNGYNVRGRIAVQDRGYRWGRSRYDTGKFTCKVRYGRISDIDYSGIRGLR